MRKHWYLLLIMLWVSPWRLPAQICTWETLAQESSFNPAPSLFELFTGGYARHTPSYYDWMLTQMNADSMPSLYAETRIRAGFPPHVLPDRSLYMTAFEWHKVVALEAIRDSSMRTWTHFVPQSCGAFYLNMAAEYLRKYGKKGGKPLFAGFNGGFANFIMDTMKVKPGNFQPEWNIAIGALEQAHLAGVIPPDVCAELMGDVILQEESRFYRRWFAAMAYLYAGRFAQDSTAAEAWDLKAIHALESNRANPRNFNRHRFNDFKKIFVGEYDYCLKRQQEVEQNEKLWKNSGKNITFEFMQRYYRNDVSNQPFEYLPNNPRGKLWELIRKDMEAEQSRLNGIDPNQDPMNTDIDLKDVKSNFRFNAYAIFLILIVVAAAVFFWVKVRKADRSREGS